MTIFSRRLANYFSSATRSKMTEAVHRGAFIVLEGGDTCGKTTHCEKLRFALEKENRKVEAIRFPARDIHTGDLINKYLGNKLDLEDHAVHLLFAANRWEAMPEMKKKLNEGVTLIADRYSYSGVAYSIAKQIEGMGWNWCWQSEIGLLRPDAVLLLATDSATAAKRLKVKESERFDGELSFQDRVLENYRRMKDDTWTEIDTNQSIEEVHAEIKSVVDGVMKDLRPELELFRSSHMTVS